MELASLTGWAVALAVALVVAYLVQLNRLMAGTPEEVRRLSPNRWMADMVRDTYRRLEAHPITPASYRNKMPPKLERRYIVTGGSGLVGGYLILQLLERGHPPSAIRNIDFQAPRRADLVSGPGAAVPHHQADIASATSTHAAFSAPWDESVAHLPLTVFHTAAVIVPSERARRAYALCEVVNVRGTQHVLASARVAGADVVVATTSGSIALRPVGFWMAPWKVLAGRSWPRGFWQVLDESDLWRDTTVRPRQQFYANYAESKAHAERLVCAANGPALRTGCIRPANSVYGSLTDSIVGGPLKTRTYPLWIEHITQSFAHGANVAIAHLQLEAALAGGPARATAPQAGRPYVVTDPNAPITYGDLFTAFGAVGEARGVAPFYPLPLPPLLVLILAHAVEAYCAVRAGWCGRTRLGRACLPAVTGDWALLKPPVFSIVTHLVSSNEEAAKSREEGGLGYQGVMTTLEGMTGVLLEWNRAMEQDKVEAKTEDHGQGRRTEGKSGGGGHSLSLATELPNLAAAATATVVASAG